MHGLRYSKTVFISLKANSMRFRKVYSKLNMASCRTICQKYSQFPIKILAGQLYLAYHTS